MPPKRRASVKATASLTNKRRQKSPEPAKTKSPQRSQTTIAANSERILSDLDREQIINELKQFDMTSKYGPCVGISRRLRWERAEKLGKKPPKHVHDLLTDKFLEEKLGQELIENLWYNIV